MRRRRRSRRSRPWRSWLVGLLIFGFGTAGGATFFLGTSPFRSLLVSLVKRHFTGDVKVETSSYRFPFGLRLEGLRVVAGEGTRPLLVGDRIDLQLAPMALLDGRLHFRSVLARGVDLSLVRDEAGQWQALRSLRSSSVPPRLPSSGRGLLTVGILAAAPVSSGLPVDRLRLEDCSLQYSDLRRFITFKVQQLGGTFASIGESIDVERLEGRCLGSIPFVLKGRFHPEANFQAHVDVGPLAIESVSEDFPFNLVTVALGLQLRGDLQAECDIRSGLGVTSVNGNLKSSDSEFRIVDEEGFVRRIRSRTARLSLEGSVREGRVAFAGLAEAEGMKVDGASTSLAEGDLRCPWRYAGSAIKLGPGRLTSPKGQMSLRSGFLQLGPGGGYELSLEGRGAPEGRFLRSLLGDVEEELFGRFGMQAPEADPESLRFQGSIMGQGGAVQFWELTWGGLRAKLSGNWRHLDEGGITGRFDGTVEVPERSASQALSLTFEGSPADPRLRLQ